MRTPTLTRRAPSRRARAYVGSTLERPWRRRFVDLHRTKSMICHAATW